MGERYVEPQGQSKIFNKNTGDECIIDFKLRTGWTPKLEDQYYVTAIIKNKSGEEFYKLEGKYT